MSVCVRCGGRALDYCHHCRGGPLRRGGLLLPDPGESGRYVEQLDEDEQRESAEVSVTTKSA